MDGATFPFVAGCIFFGVGALLILSLIQYLFQRTRWRGRAVGTIISIETLSAAEGQSTVFALQTFCGLTSMILRLLAFYVNGNLAWLGPDWQPR
jgi:hypothetical protein